MSEPDADELERRVLLLPPTARDAAASKGILESNGMLVRICEGLGQLCREAERGAGALLLTREALVSDRDGEVRRLLDDQPPWSDLPLIILTPSGPEHPRDTRAFEAFRHVTLVKRPVELSVFVSTVRAALRDRSRQYEVRAHLAASMRQAEELRMSEEALREADRRKDEFLSMLAHELRNPLAAISGASRLLKLRPDVRQLEWTGEVIERQASHLSRLIDDLLDVSRVSQGKIHLKKEAVDLRVLVDRAKELAWPLIERKHHELLVSLPETPVVLEADPTRMEQVLGNLLANSAKYMEERGRIELTARSEGDEAVFVVRDEGIGISPEMLPLIFGLFTQVDASLDRSQGGLGIGLTLVKQLVEMHGGSVVAESEGVGRGAAFTVRIPVGTPEPDREATEEEGAKFEKRRILVVDDNEDMARLTAKMLQQVGHDVVMAHDGVMALDVARSYRPEAVLLDIGLPGLDGYQVAERLRVEACCKDSLIVAISGYGEERAKERARQAGFDHHFTKPVSFDSLLGLISREWS